MKQIGAGLATLAVATQLSGLALAKDAPVVTSNVPTVAGPCSSEFNQEDSGTIYYPLTHDRYPGTVGANMKLNASSISLTNVCLEPGWTVTNQGATNGVQLRYFYNGVKAIDFKFVPGKTDIRFY